MSPDRFAFGTLAAVDRDTPAEVVRRLFDTDGAFLVKGLFEPAEILPVRSAVLGEIRRAGWIRDAEQDAEQDAEPDAEPDAPRADMAARCAVPEPPYLDLYDRVISLPRVHALPHSGSVRALAGKLGIRDPFLLPRIALRMVFPGTAPTPEHQDWTTVGGDRNAVTLWTPLTACDLATGPVAVIPRSHARGEGSVAAAADRWTTAEVRTGDAVVFRSLTIHRALPNTGQSMRVSLDFRLQDAAQPIHPCSLLPPGRFRTWDDVCEAWGEDDHRYASYWRDNHPAFTPSLADLRGDLARAEGDERRYLERVLRQVAPFA